MNKGLKLKFCKQCNKKRFCSNRILLPAREWRKWTCSKKHEWDEKVGTIEQINKVIKQVITPSLIESLFNRDDLFYARLKR